MRLTVVVMDGCVDASLVISCRSVMSSELGVLRMKSLTDVVFSATKEPVTVAVQIKVERRHTLRKAIGVKQQLAQLCIQQEVLIPPLHVVLLR